MILVFNADRTTLTFELFEKHAMEALKSVVRGKVSDIGGISTFQWGNDNVQADICVNISDIRDATDWVLDWLEHLWPLGSLLEGLKIVAHRCVNCPSSVASSSAIREDCPIGAALNEPAQCVLGISRARFPESVKIVTLNLTPDDSGLRSGSEEARIAMAALQTVVPG